MWSSILTPIKVSHSLLLEIWFSIDKPKSSEGQTDAPPPELSVMRTEKSVIVPSVSEQSVLPVQSGRRFGLLSTRINPDLGTGFVRGVVCSLLIHIAVRLDPQRTEPSDV